MAASNKRTALSSFLCFGLLFAGAALCQTDPTYTAPQARQGETLYQQRCVLCHGVNLTDGTFGPPLKGQAFMQRWAGRTVSELFVYTRSTMPPDQAGELGNMAYAQLIAYLLQANGVAAGARELPQEETLLAAQRIPGEQRVRSDFGGPLSADVTLPDWPRKPNPLDGIRKVTDAMLAAPSDGEWLTWRRTHDQQGFSPLKQIDKKNIINLQVAWSLALPPGPNEMEPLLHDGVLFVFGYRDHVLALDATSGDQLWHYQRQLPESTRFSYKRSMALYGDKLYVGTSDAHVIALNVKTGKIVWDRAIANPGEGFMLTGGPLVARGKVMQGLTGIGIAGGSYIQALDAATGKPAWRFHSIPRPGQRGDETWNDIPLQERSGGSVWIAGSYDAELNLAYFGPAPTYDTGKLRKAVGKQGINNDALYTDATIALNPDTGALVWHYQHMQNDQWDYDWAFERQVVQLPLHGKNRKLVVTGGKIALWDALDAATGAYVFSYDMGLQNLISHIDPSTGKKTIDPDLIPGPGKKVSLCPHAGGAKSWLPGSLNPRTGVMFVPVVESCMDLVGNGPEPWRGLRSAQFSVRPRPDSDGRYGRVEAVDLRTQKRLWATRQRAPQTSGVLATAGGLVFAGAVDRWFSAMDDANGKVLWQVRLSDVPSSSPISYTAGGKQYIAMMVGYGGPQSATFPKLTPEIALPVARSSSIWVFSLPD
jgi:alcohol dehydrogenase (cytochrome c)